MAWDYTKMFAQSQAAHMPMMMPHDHSHQEENPAHKRSPLWAERRRARLKRERQARKTMYQVRKRNGRNF